MNEKNPKGRKRKDILHSIDVEPKNKTYYTVTEAAEILGVHRHTIQARLRDGTIRGKMIGNTWRIYKDELFKKGD